MSFFLKDSDSERLNTHEIGVKKAQKTIKVSTSHNIVEKKFSWWIKEKSKNGEGLAFLIQTVGINRTVETEAVDEAGG